MRKAKGQIEDVSPELKHVTLELEINKFENKTVSGTVSSRPRAIGDVLDRPALGKCSRVPLR